jgi:hypothetical protein
MKKLTITLFALTLSIAYAGEKGSIFECTAPSLKQKITIKQVSNEFSKQVEKKCSKHSEIQYDWEDFAYFKVTLEGKTLSGVGCNEDVNFEFRSSNNYQGKPVALWMYLDELEESHLTIGDKTIDINCKLVFDALNR